MKVTVTADDDYYFSVSKDKVKIKGDAAKVVSTKKEDSQTLIITLDLKPMAERVGPIEYAYLNGTVATWAPAQGAVAYELYLYRDSKVVGSKRTTTETTYDFGTAIRKDGEYYYKVRAVGAEGSKEGKYTESASRYVSPSEAQALASAGNSKAADGNNANTPGQWVQDETGWRWLNPDGSYTVNNWAFINNKWYYFGENSYMATGWIQWKELWYYLGPDGDMQTNFHTGRPHGERRRRAYLVIRQIGGQKYGKNRIYRNGQHGICDPERIIKRIRERRDYIYGCQSRQMPAGFRGDWSFLFGLQCRMCSFG